MLAANIDDSKLCAEVPRHTPACGFQPLAVVQLGKGRTFGPPRCIPSGALLARAETLPVSTPSGSRGMAASSRAVRP